MLCKNRRRKKWLKKHSKSKEKVDKSCPKAVKLKGKMYQSCVKQFIYLFFNQNAHTCKYLILKELNNCVKQFNKYLSNCLETITAPWRCTEAAFFMNI